MALSFDDLIPDGQSNAQAPATNNNVTPTVDFTDLIPAQSGQYQGGGRELAIGGSGVAKGLAATAGVPGDLLQSFDKYVGSPLQRVANGQPAQFGVQDPGFSKFLSSEFPTSAQTVANADALGIADRPDLQPQNNTERYIAAAGQGVGQALPAAAMGNPAGIISTLAQGAGSGVGTQAAQDLIPNSRVASIAGGLLGGGIGSVAANTGQRVAGAIAGDASPTLQAYQTAGITPRLVGDVTQDPFWQRVQSLASKGGYVGQAATKSVDEFGSSVNDLADSLGSSHTLQEAGQQVQNQTDQWLKNWQAQKNAAYSSLDSTMGNDNYSVANLQNTISNIRGVAGGNKELDNFLSSGLSKQINSITDSADGQLSWNQIKALRTRIGEHLENPQLVADAGGAQAKQLYGALSKDMQTAAASQGPQALAQFNSANQLVSSGHDFIDGVLSKLQGNPEQAAKYLLSSGANGGSTLQAIRDNLPQAADELAAVSLRRQMAGNSNGADGNAVSPSRWLSNADPARRLSPEAYQALYPYAATQTKLSALDTVAQNMRNSEGLYNKSNTGLHVDHAIGIASPFMMMEAAARGHEFAGLPGAIAATAAIGAPMLGRLGGGFAATRPTLSKLFSNPATSSGVGFAPTALTQIPYLHQSAPFALSPPMVASN